ncbi:MAG: hypothetical protein RSH26_04850 [Clostridia bacterium]
MLKKLTPMLCLLCAAVLAAGGILWFGSAAMRRPDIDPVYQSAGAFLRHLRDGATFRLPEVFPQQWDVAQFAASPEALARWEQRLLFGYDQRYTKEAHEPVALLLLWQRAELVRVVALPKNRDGFPRFFDDFGSENFELSRDHASFLCSFISDELHLGGYYVCVPEGIST